MGMEGEKGKVGRSMGARGDRYVWMGCGAWITYRNSRPVKGNTEWGMGEG